MSLPARAALLPAAVAILYGCDLPTQPFPDGAVPFEPPPAYEAWWDLTAACAGVSRDFATVSWFVVPGAETITVNGGQYHGAWYSDGNRIVLAERAQLSGPLVRHEMLHAMIERAGHPREYYRSRCGGIVVCHGECAEESGGDPVPSPSMARMAPTELDISVQVVPYAAPSPGGKRWVGVLVSATNPESGARAVRVAESDDALLASPTFGYELLRAGIGPWGGMSEFIADSVVVFESGETKQRLFDVWLPAVDWEVRGMFNSGKTPLVRFRLDS